MLDVAKASRAIAAVEWIRLREAKIVVSGFLGKHFRRTLALRRKARLVMSANKLQAVQRGRVAGKRFRGRILIRMEEASRFSVVWSDVLSAMANSNSAVFSWSMLRSTKDREEDGCCDSLRRHGT